MQHALLWIKSDGVEQLPHGSLAAGPSTYYAEISLGQSDSGIGITLAPDATIIGTADVEATDFPFDSNVAATSTYSTADDYWKATTLTQRVINAASTATGWEAFAATAKRYRVKLVVTTAGRCPGFAITKRG